MTALLDAKYWRERAIEIQSVANTVKDTKLRDTLTGISAGYLRLAEHADQRAIVEAEKKGL